MTTEDTETKVATSRPDTETKAPTSGTETRTGTEKREPVNILAVTAPVTHQSLLATAAAHQSLIYIVSLVLILLLAMWHFTLAVLRHVLMGWIVGIMGAFAFASKLVKPAAVLAGGSTVGIPKGATVSVSAGKVHSAATIGVVPVVGVTVVLALLAVVVLSSLILTWRSPSRGLLKMAMKAASAPREEGEHE